MSIIISDLTFKIDDTRDQYGCVEATVFFQQSLTETVIFIGKSRDRSTALAYALEDLATYLKARKPC